MNNLKLSVFLLLTSFFSVSGIAQDSGEKTAEKSGFLYSVTATSVKTIKPFFDAPVEQHNEDGKVYVVKNNLRRRKYTNRANALPKGGDPLVQHNKSYHANRAPIANFEGLAQSESGGATPPDPSGAIGPNHYVQMVNSVYRIFDRNGNPLTSPASLGSLLGGGNAGDPIVMYDKHADRWFLSQFSNNNELIVAVSQTPDPTGNYYLYTFPLQSFPDYPKYSVWSDGYYVTSNKSGDNVMVLERGKMLIGDPNAQIIGFNIPSLNTNGFFSVLPANASSTLPPVGTPNYLFYYQDDAWAGGTDHVKAWEVNVDWATPSNSSISSPQTITVSPFDSEFSVNWDDISQPGTSAKLDAVPGALMYMAHFRSFPGYDVVVLNHTVDVNGANQAGIRWYELRKNNGSANWTLYQEGTFSPDNQNRWMGSIAMDNQGNIGLAYSVSGSSTYPSLRYTGRYASDPLGQMTLAEETIINGNDVQTGINRFGDYAQMTLDPLDDATFWFTGEYIANGEWKTRITSFKIASNFNDDLGVTAVTSPVDGALSNSENITVNIRNFGLNNQANFPVAYQIDGGAPVVETYSGIIISGGNASYTFTTPADLSNVGTYSIKAYTDLSIDQARVNDTVIYAVNHLQSADVGVTAITAPTSSSSLGANETVVVSVTNFGAQAQSNFPVSYQINNNPAVTESYSGTLASGATASMTFSTTANLNVLGVYNMIAYTSLTGDANLSNDTSSTTINHEMCHPVSDCSYGDGLVLFHLNTINNSSSCSANGYADYMSMSTQIERTANYPLTVQSGYSEQHGTIWVDFNDNFNFEPNERVLTDFQFGTSQFDTLFSVDANAPLGEHILRIQTNWQAAPGSNGCDSPSSSYGETEDYKINVVAFSSVAENESSIGLNINQMDKNTFTVSLDNIENKKVNLVVSNTLGQQIVSDSFNSSSNYNLKLNNMAEGYYLIRVFNDDFSKIAKVFVRK